MGTHLGQVLKSARARRDLHGLLGRTVIEARQYLDMGRRTGEPTSLTPVADLENIATPLPVAAREIDAQKAVAVDDTRRGLLHRIPFFRRKQSPRD
jgi:hypothetical protein